MKKKRVSYALVEAIRVEMIKVQILTEQLEKNQKECKP